MDRILNLIFNIILIPKYSYYGACIGTIIAEFFVMFYQIVKTKKQIEYKKLFSILFEYILKSIVMFAIIEIIGQFIININYRILIQIIAAVLVYFFLNYKYIRYEFLGK